MLRGSTALLASGIGLSLVAVAAVGPVEAASAGFTVPAPGACAPTVGASPAQWMSAIGLPVPISGTPLPQTIVILEQNQVPNMPLVTATLEACGLPVPSMTIQPDTAVPPQSPIELEATLDMLVVAAAAPPNASIVLVNSGGTMADMYMAGARACGVQVNGKPGFAAQATMQRTAAFPAGGCIITSSHGMPEQSTASGTQLNITGTGTSDAIDDLYDVGVVMVNSAGDSGSGGCTLADQGITVNGLSPTFPASHPYVIGVGGTQWMPEIPTLTGQRPGLVVGQAATQWVWKDAYGEPKCSNYTWSGGSGAAAGGGGFSSVYGANPIQKPLTQGNYPNLSGNRLTPDVAALGGWPFYALSNGAGGWTYFYGTSAAAPSVAAGLAQVNASLTARRLPPLASGGSVDALTALYANPSDMADVTWGGNDLMGLTWNGNPAWAALQGYDMATGIGVPNFSELAASLTSQSRSSDPDKTRAPRQARGESSALALAGGVRVDRDTPSVRVDEPLVRGDRSTIRTTTYTWFAPRLTTSPSARGVMQVLRSGKWISVAPVRADASGAMTLQPMRVDRAGRVSVRVLENDGDVTTVIVKVGPRP